MAPKRQPHDLPPQTNSSDSDSEDEQHSSSSSDDSDSEPQQLTQSSKPHQQSDSDAESDSESGSDSDASSDKTPKTPSVVSPQPKKPTSKSTQLKANGKRPAEPEVIEKPSKSKKSKSEVIEKPSKSKSVQKVDKGSDKSGKKSKVSNGDEEGAEIEDKKGWFPPRVFSENDSIVLLQGIIDFKEKKGIDPSVNLVAFQESVEDLLSCRVTKSQIADKIRRLKKKYIMNCLKKGENGEDPVFSRPLDYQSFQLSKKIWASEVGESEVDGDSKVKSSSKKKDGNVASKTLLKSDGKKDGDFEEEVMDKDDCWSLYPCLCNSLESEARNNFKGPISLKEYVRKVVSGFNKEKAIELEQEWEDVNGMEQQAYAKRVAVISKQAEAAMNVIQP